jgi:ankyrin repeat protein
VTEGHIATVRALIAFGCAVNLGDDDRKTALHYACGSGKVDVVKVLLESPEIDIHAKDVRGVVLGLRKSHPTISHATSGQLLRDF